jgi:hypothetical protein
VKVTDAEATSADATNDAAAAQPDVGAAASLGAIPKVPTANLGSLPDLSEILEAKVNQARSNRQSLSHMSLDQVDRASIEKFLASLRRPDGEAAVAMEEGAGAVVNLDDDLDDSARAESIVSMTSTNSNKSRDPLLHHHRHRR